MPIKGRSAWLWLLAAPLLGAAELPPDPMRIEVTFSPALYTDFSAAGNIAEAAYGSSFSGATQSFLRVEAQQAISPRGAFYAGFWHSGVLPGRSATYGREKAGDYQENDLAVSFSNFFVGYAHRLGDSAVEGLCQFSIDRMVLYRNRYQINGGDPVDHVDIHTFSGEGFGFGLRGKHKLSRHGFYLEWQSTGNQLIVLADSDTDFTGGHLFNAETAIGWSRGGWDLSVGGLYQWFKMASQSYQRHAIPGTNGAITTWGTQEITSWGPFVTAQVSF